MPKSIKFDDTLHAFWMEGAKKKKLPLVSLVIVAMDEYFTKHGLGTITTPASGAQEKPKKEPYLDANQRKALADKAQRARTREIMYEYARQFTDGSVPEMRKYLSRNLSRRAGQEDVQHILSELNVHIDELRDFLNFRDDDTFIMEDAPDEAEWGYGKPKKTLEEKLAKYMLDDEDDIPVYTYPDEDEYLG